MKCALWDNVSSFWLAEEYTPNPPLIGQIQVDIAIIGGGVTGLSSAYHLKQRYPEKHIVLLEGQAVGFGASGRNSGFISQEYHGWYERFQRKGAATVEPYARYAERGYQLLVQTIRQGNCTSSAVKTEELGEVGQMPASAFAFDVQRAFAGIPP
jgi:glycine/D-amino acid oxidase-like deaminating enzyme